MINCWVHYFVANKNTNSFNCNIYFFISLFYCRLVVDACNVTSIRINASTDQQKVIFSVNSLITKQSRGHVCGRKLKTFLWWIFFCLFFDINPDWKNLFLWLLLSNFSHDFMRDFVRDIFSVILIQNFSLLTF